MNPDEALVTQREPKTLLIWDRFGEADLALYVIEDAPEWLAQCHQQFLNVLPEDFRPLLELVHDALCSEPNHYIDPDHALAGAWADKKVDTREIATLKGELHVVICGVVP